MTDEPEYFVPRRPDAQPAIVEDLRRPVAILRTRKTLTERQAEELRRRILATSTAKPRPSLHATIKEACAFVFAIVGVMFMASGLVREELGMPWWAGFIASMSAAAALAWWQDWPPFSWRRTAQTNSSASTKEP